MSIRCGHCKDHHETIPEVRACSLQAAPRTDTPSDGANRLAQVLTVALAPLEPGFYRSGAKVFRLAQDGTWALLMSNGRFSDGARAPYRPERMTVEDVAAEGKILVRCIVCGIRLTNPESKARGIGPICAGRV